MRRNSCTPCLTATYSIVQQSRLVVLSDVAEASVAAVLSVSIYEENVVRLVFKCEQQHNYHKRVVIVLPTTIIGVDSLVGLLVLYNQRNMQ